MNKKYQQSKNYAKKTYKGWDAETRGYAGDVYGNVVEKPVVEAYVPAEKEMDMQDYNMSAQEVEVDIYDNSVLLSTESADINATESVDIEAVVELEAVVAEEPVIEAYAPAVDIEWKTPAATMQQPAMVQRRLGIIGAPKKPAMPVLETQASVTFDTPAAPMIETPVVTAPVIDPVVSVEPVNILKRVPRVEVGY